MLIFVIVSVVYGLVKERKNKKYWIALIAGVAFHFRGLDYKCGT